MMLNPTKYVFGVPAGQLLGFIVSHRGIEVNPEKIKAILEISRPNDLKDVQRLTGYMTIVSRFISRLGEKALPLYKCNNPNFWEIEINGFIKIPNFGANKNFYFKYKINFLSFKTCEFEPLLPCFK
jgi:hypothetical protein